MTKAPFIYKKHKRLISAIRPGLIPPPLQCKGVSGRGWWTQRIFGIIYRVWCKSTMLTAETPKVPLILQKKDKIFLGRTKIFQF